MDKSKSFARPMFEGRYYKQQNGRDTIAFIPARHCGQDGRPSASLQAIVNREVYQFELPGDAFSMLPDGSGIRLGDSVFSQRGCLLDCAGERCRITGALRYGPARAPSYDMMGPFCLVPFMQCRHSVFSLSHRVEGELRVNGRPYRFIRGTGYIEGDRGVSFPSRYLWTQGNWRDNCVMLSVADIPLAGLRFTGCIGAVLYEGVEYRLATYLGVRVEHIDGNHVLVRQGGCTLQVRLLDASPSPLRAPQTGRMSRTIHESAACRVRYTFRRDGATLFDVVLRHASYENAWTNC